MKQNEKAKDGPFYEANKTKTRSLLHKMVHPYFFRFALGSLYNFPESFNFLMRMDHSMKQTKPKHEVWGFGIAERSGLLSLGSPAH